MRTEFVERRAWLTEQEFLDLVGASNLIPGPGSTEVAIFIGLRRAGWSGMLLAGLCFILPASVMVLAIAWAYGRFGALPAAVGMLYGIKPVIIAVVAQALWMLSRTALKSRPLALVAAVALVLCLVGAQPLPLLLGIGGLLGFVGWWRYEARRSAQPLVILVAVVAVLAGLPLVLMAFLPTASATVTLSRLLLVFVKIGSVLYGSGYVLLVFLRDDLVTRLHWITPAQLLDAVAVGQFTPGPVFTTATFIGYLILGAPGAVVATVGIFLPAFLLVAVSGWLLPAVRRSPSAAAFLDGVNAAALALMAFVTWQLAQAALVDPLTIALAATAALLLLRWRVNSALLVLGGALTGALLHGS